MDRGGPGHPHACVSARIGRRAPRVVDVFTPTVAGNEWTCGHTVVQVITDDMPFLLDSVVAAITAQGRSLHLRRPPDLRGGARRRRRAAGGPAGASGRRTRSPRPASPGSTSRSTWRRDPAGAPGPRGGSALGPARRPRGGRGLAADDVAGAGRWPTSCGRTRPPSVPAKYSEEAAEFLQWLGEGNFTFLGYRTLRPRARSGPGGPGEPAAATGLGLAALGPHRSRSPSPTCRPRCARMPPSPGCSC